MDEALDQSISNLVYKLREDPANQTLEEKVNDLVADAYGLTPTERRLVDDWFTSGQMLAVESNPDDDD